MKRYLRKFIRIVLWTIAGAFFIIVLAVVLIQLPAVQNYAKGKAVVYLQKKLGTKVQIGRLSVIFPKKIVLENIYLEDQHHDTLLAGGSIHINISMFKLLRSKIALNNLELENITTHIHRLQPDTVFNYTYIVNAFASTPDTTKKTDTSSSAFTFEIGNIHFKNIAASFQDDASGNEIHVFLGDFSTRIKDFDPAKMIYNIPAIHLNDIHARMRTYKPTLVVAGPPPDSTKAGPIQASIRLDTLDLQKIGLQYDDETAAMHAKIDLLLLNVLPGKIDLAKTAISVKKIELQQTQAFITLDKQTKPVIVKKVQHVADSVQQLHWHFDLAKLLLKNNSFTFNNNNTPPIHKGMDYNHLLLSAININAKNIILEPNAYTGQIDSLSLKEKSGIDLQKLSTSFSYKEKQASLKDLLIKTSHSQINNQLTLKYPSVASISQQPGEVFVDMQLTNSHLAVADIVTAAPMLASQLKKYNQSVILIDGKAKGYIKDVTIDHLTLSGIGSTALQLSGNMKGLPDAKNAWYNITLKQFTTTNTDIYNLAPPKSIPDSIRIPPHIHLDGFFKGRIKDFVARLNARTSNGNLLVNGSMQNNGTSYNATLSADKVDVGYILRQEKNVGTITLHANAKGSGLDYKKMTADLDAQLIEANIKGYAYHDLSLKANMKQGIATLDALINDPNIRFNLQTIVDVRPKWPAIDLTAKIDTINLQALHMAQRPLTIHSLVTASFPVTNPDSLIGQMKIKDITIIKDSLLLTTDSIAVIAKQVPDTSTLSLITEMATAQLQGRYKLTEVATALQHTINQYYKLPGFKDTAFTAQNWRLDIHLTPSPLVLQLMPQLKGTDTVGAHIQFVSTSNNLQLQVKAPHMQYGTQTIEQTGIYATTNDKQLLFGASIQKAGSKSFYVNQTELKGRLEDNVVYTSLNSKDNKNKDKYTLAVQVKQVPHNGVQVSFDKDSLRLNYDRWTVSDGNYIQYDTTGLRVHNLELSQAGQSLRIASQQENTTAPIEVAFKDFRIKTLTNFAQQDSLLADGVINGQAVIKDALKNPVFTSNLTVSNLSYKQDTLGNLTLKVNNEEANTYTANIALKGDSTDIQLNGKYYTGESRMDLHLVLNQLNLAIAKTFAAGQLKDIGGNLEGKVDLAGTTTQPDINGNLHFVKAFIQPTMLGERFNLPDEKIDVNNNGIQFNNFTLVDSAGNKAILNGNINTTNLSDIKFGLDLRANDFTVVNASKSDNAMFYGKMNIDAKIKVTGNMNAPVVNATLKANKSTDFTFVLPTSNPEVQSRDGVVHFIDRKAVIDSTIKAGTDSLVSALAGMDVTADIETDSAARFTVVVDERNGDALQIRGRSDLAFSMDPSGKMSLTGNYIVRDGSYNLTLSVLKKKFTLQNGSTITWTGDPMSANINLTGLYEIKTSGIDLVADQMAGTSNADMTRFKQRLPFSVQLILTGEMLKPIIKFNITLPEDQQSQYKEIETRLEQLRTDESEMNKQVFALLLLGRFVQEDPLQSDAASTTTGTLVRQSVSNLLADQLNKLAGSLIKGVDLNFDLNSEDDYTTGNRETTTNLTIGASKSLLNDRLKVTVGSNFALEGQNAQQQSGQNASNIAGDVQVDYQLSKDGRYLIRGYRKNKYDAVVEGQVVETGLTFVFTLDYDRFRELFQSKKNHSRKQKQKKTSATSTSTQPTNTSTNPTGTDQ